MKLRLSKEQGGTLLVVLFSSLIMGVSLASFLQYTSTQARSIKRSQAWNNAIPVAEAGVEEALAHINDSTVGTNFAINGWTAVGNEIQRVGFVSGQRYFVRLSTNVWPVVTSTGYTKDGRTTNTYSRTVRVTTTRAGTGIKGLVAKGDVTMNGTTEVDSFDSEDERYSTFGRYDASKRKDGGYVASVYGNVSSANIYGTVGTGPTGTASGNVGNFAWRSSNSGIQPGAYKNDVSESFPAVQEPWTTFRPPLTPGVATVTNYNYVSTMVVTTNPPAVFPPTGVITNVSGSTNVVLYPAYPPVGTPAAWITTNWTPVLQQRNLPATGIYRITATHNNGKYDYDLLTSYSYKIVGTNYTYSTTATNATVTTTAYDYLITQAAPEVEMSSLSMSGSKQLVVAASNAVLYIKNDFKMAGQSELIILPGASLSIYVGGSFDMAGNGIFNQNLDASKLNFYGLPSNKEIKISGNAAFTGTIYAPTADVHLSGGGTTIYDVVGAIVANSADLKGHFRFHYDERLGRAKVLAKYVVASWKEI